MKLCFPFSIHHHYFPPCNTLYSYFISISFTKEGKKRKKGKEEEKEGKKEKRKKTLNLCVTPFPSTIFPHAILCVVVLFEYPQRGKGKEKKKKTKKRNKEKERKENKEKKEIKNTFEPVSPLSSTTIFPHAIL